MLKFSECSRLIWGQKWGTLRTLDLVIKSSVSIMSTTNFNQNEWRTTHSILPTPRLERFINDPQTGVERRQASLCNLRSEYRCSMCPAIHTISRILLRPSSTYEPSDPPLRIFQMFSYWQLYKSISPTPLCDKNTQLLALARKQFQISSSHANIALASQLCSPTHTSAC